MRRTTQGGAIHKRKYVYVDDNHARPKVRCGRCGILTAAEFCRDCQGVDPMMTAGGKTARELADERKVATAEWREECRVFYDLAGKARGPRK